MKINFSLRKKFNAVAAGVALMAAGPAIPPQAQAQTAVVQPLPTASTGAGYRPYSPTGEQCPVENVFAPPKVWPTPNFDVSPKEQQRLVQSLGMNIGRNDPDGLFTERMTASVNEFRHMYYGNVYFHESFSPSEMTDLRAFAAQALREQKANGLTLETAVALRFAAHATGVDYQTLLTETDKGHKKFEPETATLLQVVKNYGPRYGLGFFADRITLKSTASGVDVSVSDPVILQLLLALPAQPRIGRVMQAEYLKHKAELPQAKYVSSVTDVSDLYKKQLDLVTLGMMQGGVDGQATPQSDIAIAKFRALYAPLVAANADPLDYLSKFAQLARTDAAEHSISSAAAAAIRLANLRTGANFGYMMELSSAESQFDVDAQASTSSARGLYQFTEDTWIQTINRYGEKYSMKPLSDHFDAKDDMNGTLVGRSENPFVRALSMELRNDPHLAAVMSGEFQMRNKFVVECAVGHNLNRTEQYFGHFLGAKGAAQFIIRMNDRPASSAPDMFGQAADANKSVFYKRDSRGRRLDRSLSEVYQVFSRKFDRDSYEDTDTSSRLINSFIPQSSLIQWPDYATRVTTSAPDPVPVYVPPPKKKASAKSGHRPRRHAAPAHRSKRRH